jgi:hypothetical protein
MKGFARRGAEARLAELNQEIAAIHAAFPDLRRGRVGRPAGRVVVNHEETNQDQREVGRTGARKRRAMTAAERRAVGARMKKYWAARRAEAAAKKR